MFLLLSFKACTFTNANNYIEVIVSENCIMYFDITLKGGFLSNQTNS